MDERIIWGKDRLRNLEVLLDLRQFLGQVGSVSADCHGFGYFKELAMTDLDKKNRELELFWFSVNKYEHDNLGWYVPCWKWVDGVAEMQPYREYRVLSHG